jgi:bacillithiol system protein YtxJ
MRDLAEDGALDDVRQAELAVIYKHSPICPVSWSAKREVTRFVEQNPNAQVYVVNVVQDRALSRQLADDLGVRHESPQAILMQAGKATKHASHHQITAKLLKAWVSDAAG